jgi:hypothetical protein
LIRELTGVTCLPCNADDHWLCWNPKIDKCCCFDKRESFENIGNTEKSALGGYQKPADSITDVQSTGRKRAAVMYPISDGMICEWSQLRYAGGGVIPVIGCFNNPATDTHHGPSKSTLDNRPENVHRICATCHVRWHSANDQYYGKRPDHGEPFIPIDDWYWTDHDRETKATPEEVVLAQTQGEWKAREAMKIGEYLERRNQEKVLEQG